MRILVARRRRCHHDTRNLRFQQSRIRGENGRAPLSGNMKRPMISVLGSQHAGRRDHVPDLTRLDRATEQDMRSLNIVRWVLAGPSSRPDPSRLDGVHQVQPSIFKPAFTFRTPVTRTVSL